jgi:hypothetical protein
MFRLNPHTERPWFHVPVTAFTQSSCLTDWKKTTCKKQNYVRYVISTDKTSIVIRIVAFWWNKIVYNKVMNDLLLCCLWEHGLDASRLGHSPFTDSCEHGNEPLGFVYGGTFLDTMKCYQRLRMYSAPWSYLGIPTCLLVLQ